MSAEKEIVASGRVKRKYRVKYRPENGSDWPWKIEAIFDLGGMQGVGLFPSRDWAERCREALEESERKGQQ